MNWSPWTRAAEIPLVFQCWEKWLREAGIGNSLAEVDFIEMHVFSLRPKAPNPLLDPEGFAGQQRLYQAYREAYGNWFRTHCPDNGLRRALRSMLSMSPTKAASYEFYSTALYQKALQQK